MISSVFGKTKPINYIIVSTLLGVAYTLVRFVLRTGVYRVEDLALDLTALGFLIGTVYLTDFIVKRNKLTAQDSYAIMFYLMLCLVFSGGLNDNNAIFCSFFLLWAMGRIIAMRSQRNRRLKIFEAGLWVLVSSLFYDWALLYFILVFSAIYLYDPKNLLNWVVPLVSLFVFVMIVYAWLVITGHHGFLVEHYEFNMGFNLDYFLDLGHGVRLVLYIVLCAAAALFTFFRLGKSVLGKIITMRLTVLYFILAMILKVLLSSPDDHPIMVSFFPAVVFFSNYTESLQKENVRTILLVGSAVLAVSLFVTDLIFL